VARSGTGRIINPSTCTTSGCNKGKVTFAYSFPLDADIAKQPRTYKMQFVVANEFISTWSQMLNYEAGTVAGIPTSNPTISTHRSRILEYRAAGKTFIPASGVDLLDNVCSIKTANAVGVDPALQYPVVNPTFAGAWDGCFGEGGQRARTFATAFNTSSSVAVDPITDQVVIAGTTGTTGGNTSTKIALAKFDKTGKQTMAVEYTPTGVQVGSSSGNLKVIKVLVSGIRGEIYVFGTRITPDSEFPTGHFFVLRFSSTGVANAYFNVDESFAIGYDLHETGDMILGPVNSSFPNNQPVYILYPDRVDTVGGIDRSWKVTALDGGFATPGTIPLFSTISTFGNQSAGNPTPGTFTWTIGVTATNTPVALTGNGSNMVAIGYDTAPTATSLTMLNFSIDYSGNNNSSWGFGGLGAFYAFPSTATGNHTFLTAGAKFAVTSAKLLSNGKLLVAGTARTGAAVTSDADTFIFQSTATGVLDTAGFTPAAVFNTATRFYNCSPSVTTDDLVPTIALRPNGEIFVVSYGSTGHCVARLSAIGTVISTQDYDLAFGYVKSPASSAQFTAAGRLAIGGTAGTSAIVGLIKQ
jgi:hypothetical protein